MGFFGFLFWFVISIVVGAVASNKGRSGIGWFFISLLITPIISLIILLCIGDSDEKKEASLKKAMSVINQEKKIKQDDTLTQEQAITELEKAKKLLALEVISQEEYDAKKAELMPILRNDRDATNNSIVKEKVNEIEPLPNKEEPQKSDVCIPEKMVQKNENKRQSKQQHPMTSKQLLVRLCMLAIFLGLIVFCIIQICKPKNKPENKPIIVSASTQNSKLSDTDDPNVVVIGRWSLKSVYDSSIEIMEIYKKDGKYYSNERGGQIILLDKRGDRYYYTGMDYANDSYYKIVNGNLRICDDELGDYTEHSGYIITKLK